MPQNQFKNLGEILDYVNYELGQDLSGHYISPEDLTLIGNEVQVEYFNDQVNMFEVNREVSSNMIPFTKTAGDDVNPPIYINEYGKADFPADCVYNVRANYFQYLNKGCSTSAKYKQIVFTPQDFYGGAMNMPMMNPLTNPKEVPAYAVIESGQLKVVHNVGQFSMTYLRLPDSINFDYEEIGGEPVYLPPGTYNSLGVLSTSKEFEWRPDVLPILASRILEKAAINIRSSFNIQTNKQ